MIRFVLPIMLLVGCQTTAPTNYELNRRAGLPVSMDNQDNSDDDKVDSELSKIRTGTSLSKEARMPVRLPGVVEKVWIFGQRINKDHWLQGTWMFVEVDREKWLGDVDSGHGDWIAKPPVEKK